MHSVPFSFAVCKATAQRPKWRAEAAIVFTSSRYKATLMKRSRQSCHDGENIRQNDGKTVHHRQTDRQRGGEGGREGDRQTETEAERQRQRERDRQTEREVARERKRQTDRQTGRQTYRQTERYTDRDRGRETETER